MRPRPVTGTEGDSPSHICGTQEAVTPKICDRTSDRLECLLYPRRMAGKASTRPSSLSADRSCHRLLDMTKPTTEQLIQDLLSLHFEVQRHIQENQPRLTPLEIEVMARSVTSLNRFLIAWQTATSRHRHAPQNHPALGDFSGICSGDQLTDINRSRTRPEQRVMRRRVLVERIEDLRVGRSETELLIGHRKCLLATGLLAPTSIFLRCDNHAFASWIQRHMHR